MNEDVLRNFSRVLAVQSVVVQQHFIHVLMLRAWGEEAAAERIASIDAIDLHDLLLAGRRRAVPRRDGPPSPSTKGTWRGRATGSRPTMVSSRPGGRDGRFPGSTIPASVSSGCFASTCGAEAPVPLHRLRSRPEPAGISAGGWYRQTRTGSRHSTESSGLARRRVRATMPLNSSSRSVRPSA